MVLLVLWHEMELPCKDGIRRGDGIPGTCGINQKHASMEVQVAANGEPDQDFNAQKNGAGE